MLNKSLNVNGERRVSEIQSLARGLKLMELLAASPEDVGVTELANEMGIDKSSVSRLIQTLAAYGYAEQDPVSAAIGSARRSSV